MFTNILVLIHDIFGTPCFFMQSLVLCKGLKMVLGGFFIAIYRFILMRIPNVVLNIKQQRQITNQLIVLEWISLGLLSVIFEIGRTATSVGFVCINQSIEITETPEWPISSKIPFLAIGIVLVQIFIVGELIIYLILFKDQYEYNKELQNGKSLGLSKDNLQKRHRKNVISLFGQFATFVIEFVTSVIYHVAIHMEFSAFNIKQSLDMLLVFSYFTSPELRQFYFIKE